MHKTEREAEKKSCDKREGIEEKVKREESGARSRGSH